MDGAETVSPSIKAISKSVVHKICSGQVILDLQSAVKELVENSLDAGATSIEVNLKDYGEGYLKVTDNGSGISPDNFQALARKHHTSKITDFSDLNSLTTFGFRGEALSSLCAMGKLTVETRTKNEPIGTHLTYDHSGLVIEERKIARQTGTTVTVEKLFSSLPVRSKEFSRNIRREYGKLVSLLNAYALMARGVRFLCTNTTGRSSKSVVLKTQGSSSLKDNIITVFGLNTFQCLEPLNLCISEGCKVEGYVSRSGHGSGRNLGDRQYFYVNGRPVDMPKVNKLLNELYRSSNSKQYPIAIMNFIIPTTSYDVNVTPDKRRIFFSDECSIVPSLREAIENIYSPNECSFSISRVKETKKDRNDFELAESDEEDSPDSSSKQQSTEGDILLETICSEEQTVDENSPAIPQLHGQGLCKKNKIPHVDETLPSKDQSNDECDYKICDNLSAYRCKPSVSFFKSNAVSEKKNHTLEESLKKSNSSSNSIQPSLANFIITNKRKHENSCNILTESPVLRNGTSSSQVNKTSPEMNASVSRFNSWKVSRGNFPEAKAEKLIKYFKLSNISRIEETALCDRRGVRNTELNMENVEVLEAPMPAGGKLDGVEVEHISGELLAPPAALSDVVTDVLKSCSGFMTCFISQFNMNDLRKQRYRRISSLPSRISSNSGKSGRRRHFTAATLDNSQPENDGVKANSLAAATIELERCFRKEDFGRMQVVGQFNLGFIIGKLDQDLFIIDQHAADEKYNFERLSESTVMHLQPLLKPLRLELSPEEEIVASTNMDIIRKNGFSLKEDMVAAPGQRFLLKAVPFSKNITFGIEDLKDLISALTDGQGECSVVSSYKADTSDSICPSRVRAMLASRACRTSVMIGDALTRNEMQIILRNLVSLKSPWNCPHGRPTMRHLADLTTFQNERHNLME